MSCPGVEELEQFVAGAPDEPARHRLEAHLSSCPECRERAAQVRQHLDLAGRVAQAGVWPSAEPTQSAEEADSAAATVARPPPGAPRSPLSPRAAPGAAVAMSDSIPGYAILREISRGGQGVVYQAIQQSTNRKVALKVMREGPLAGAAERLRFEREVHVLGQLRHPNIVTIHDTGTAAGCDYFVMDYIGGQSLDEWMSGGLRPIDATLRLFEKICDAVNAAHLQGVIHRDLKPGNVRVDAQGEPHILDFGLAKVALGAAWPRVVTLTGQFVGSLPWSSPEQAEGAAGKIDIRTDVYALGVILYQMLTGRFPYDVIGNMRDVLDRIMTAAPVRPSAVRRQINDEIETIVLKCLSKERERRYQSAGELGRDIGHYLAGEPIEAKRDSGFYVLRKALARYRMVVGVAAAFAAVVVVGAAISLGMYLHAERQRQTAEEQRARAVQRESQLRVLAAFQSAMLERIDLTRAGAMILRALRDQIDGRMRAEHHPSRVVERTVRDYSEAARWANPADLAQEVLKSQLLLPAAATIDKEFADNPELEAALRHHLAGIFVRLGVYNEGIEQSRRAVATRRRLLGDEHPDTLASIQALGAHLLLAGELQDAEPLCREAAEKCPRVLGADDPLTLGALQTLGSLLTQLTNLDEALPYCQRALEGRRRVLGDAHPDTLTSLVQLGDLMRIMERPAEAEELLQAALAGRQQALGSDAPATLACLDLLGTLYRWTDRLDEAERCFGRALDGFRRVLGEEHPETIGAANDLATFFWLRGRFDEAADLFGRNLDIARRRGGDECSALDGLALVAKSRGQFVEAEKHYKESMRLVGAALPRDHKWFALHKAGLGACIAHQGRFAEAEPLLVEGCTAILSQPIAPHFRREHLTNIIYLYEAWNAAEPGKGYEQKAAAWRARLAEITQKPSAGGPAASRPANPTPPTARGR